MVITPQSFLGMQTRLEQTLDKEGVDPTLHPATTAALNRIADEPGPITLEGAERLRRITKAAAGAQNADDRRLANMVVDQLDEYMDSLTPTDVSAGDPVAAVDSLVEARNLWRRMRNTETIDELVERAANRAGQFSGSGFENALRTEFRQVAQNKNRMRGYTKEEQDAIKKVARGGTLDNVFRYMGKFAPTGVVSAALTGGLGAAALGPLGAALPIAGLAGRAMATGRTEANVARARELMAEGPGMAATRCECRAGGRRADAAGCTRRPHAVAPPGTQGRYPWVKHRRRRACLLRPPQAAEQPIGDLIAALMGQQTPEAAEQFGELAARLGELGVTGEGGPKPATAAARRRARTAGSGALADELIEALLERLGAVQAGEVESMGHRRGRGAGAIKAPRAA